MVPPTTTTSPMVPTSDPMSKPTLVAGQVDMKAAVDVSGILSGAPAAHVIHDLATMRALRREIRAGGQTLALVPTMGALHEGHLNLMAEAAARADIVVCSIFVNPAQFAPHEDLAQYPRTLDADVAALRTQGIVRGVFAPAVATMYPRGITTLIDQQVGTFVTVQGLSHMMEGVARPHFFRGVATVVTKLLNAVEPDIAVFGQKDAQQCVVVRAMVSDLLMPVQMYVAPTVRDPVDGLALSSRNRYLNAAERSIAPAFSRGLIAAQQAFNAGEVRREALLQIVRETMQKHDAEGLLKIEYLSLANRHLHEVDIIDRPRQQQASSQQHLPMSPLADPDDAPGAILSGAVRLGTTRLIDNVLLGMAL